MAKARVITIRCFLVVWIKASNFKIFGIDSGTLLNDHTMQPLYRGFYSDEEFVEFENFYKGNGSRAKVLPQTPK